MIRAANHHKPQMSSHSRARTGRDIRSTSPPHLGSSRQPYLSGHGNATELEKFHTAWKKKVCDEHPLFSELFFDRTLPVARPVVLTEAELAAEPNAAARERLRDQTRKIYVDQMAKIQVVSETLCKKYFNTLSDELQAVCLIRLTLSGWSVWLRVPPTIRKALRKLAVS
jgi:hypothetical protein